MEKKLITVVMVFSFDLAKNAYRVAFMEKDGMTALPWTGRYKTQEPLYRIVNASYQPMSADGELARKLRSTRRGMVRLRLTAQQYDRLKKARQTEGQPVVGCP